MSALQAALDRLTPGDLLERLATHLGKPAPRFQGSRTDGMCADFRPGCEEENPSFSYRQGNSGAVFKRFGGDDFEGGAVALLQSVGLAKSEAVALLLDWAGVPDDKPTPGEGMRVGRFQPTPKQVAEIDKDLKKLEKLRPMTPEDHAKAVRGWVRVEVGEDSPEARQIADRGLTPALTSGALVAYRFTGKVGPENGPHKTVSLPGQYLPGVLGFDLFGPDLTAWQFKGRNPGNKEALDRQGKQRYAYSAVKGYSTPAHVCRILAKEDGQPTRFLLVEGELNGVAVFVMLETLARGAGHIKPDARAQGWEIQGVGSAKYLPHVDHIPAGAQVYIYADPDEDGEKAREKWAALLASRGCQVYQLGSKEGLHPFDVDGWQADSKLDACDALALPKDAPVGMTAEIHAAFMGQKLLGYLEEVKPWQPKTEEGGEEKPAKKAPKALTKKAEKAASVEAENLPAAADIPDPEGQGGSYSDSQIKELLGLPFPTVAADTDTAHAYRLQKLAGEDLAYIPELGGYAAFNGKQWLSGGKDGPGQVEAKRYAQRLGVAMGPEVERLLRLYGVLAVDATKMQAKYGYDSDEAKAARSKAEAMEKAFFQHSRAAKATESDSKQRAILSSAQPLYIKPISDFEPRPWVVGFQNGVWDKGNFRPARRDDHMLNLAAVEYLPDADRADWLEVLERITGGDKDLAQTLQDVAGYAFSGASSLRRLPWLYGEGGTGKSTYGETLASALGEMAVTISPKHLATDADRERLGAVIYGKRAALCAEAGNARLDAESLKTLSGGDRLAVRKLYAESFTARPSHVLLMVANDAPRVEAYDDALKDRVIALPFTHPLAKGPALLGGRRLEEVRQDPKSPLVLGFVAWAVEGMARVYQTGKIHMAEVCQKATKAFWNEVDPLKDFWATLDRSALAVDGVPVGEMRAAYEAWAKESGYRALSAQKFNKAAGSKGLASATISNRRVWVMENPALFPHPGDEGPDGEEKAATGQITGITENNLNPQNPKTSSSYREREKDFSRNGVKPVIPVRPDGPTASASPDDWAGSEDL